MAKYTIEFGKLCKSGFQPFDESWGTFIPEHKQELCDKIVRYYYFNEIGAETPERFRHYLNTQLELEMPTFNKLYESELWKLFPLYNVVMETTSTGAMTAKQISEAVGRKDAAILRTFGETLHHDSKDDDWTKFNQNVHGVTNTTGNLTGNHDETELINKDGTKVYEKTNDDEMNETANRTINVQTNSTEVVDDDTTGHTTGSETTNTTSQTWSSDTPQGRVTAAGLDIDSQYLTNYSHASENKNRNYSEDTKGTDDKTTTFEQTVKTDDDLVRKVTDDKLENYDEKTHETIDRVKNNKDTEDTTGWTDEDTDTDATTHYTSDKLSHDFKQSTGRDNSSDVNALSNSGSSEQSTENVQSVMGSSGISKVELLSEYRKSLINIDMMIIKAIGNNFMGVF